MQSVDFDLDSNICYEVPTVPPSEDINPNEQPSVTEVDELQQEDHNDNIAEIAKMFEQYPALVNTLSTSEKQLCGICDCRHSVCRCYYLREGNMPVVFQCRIKQFRVRLKDTIAKMDAEDAKRDAGGSVQQGRLPNPRTAQIPSPKISTVSAEQREATKTEIPPPTTEHRTMDSQPYTMSIDEKKNIQQMEDLLQEFLGDNSDEIATPAINSQSTQDADMIVDFREGPQNLVPIFPEFEDDLVPSDYDAYGGGALNW